MPVQPLPAGPSIPASTLNRKASNVECRWDVAQAWIAAQFCSVLPLGAPTMAVPRFRICPPSIPRPAFRSTLIRRAQRSPANDYWYRHCTRTVHAGSSVRSGPLQHAGTQWMLPSQSWKSVEVGVGGHHRASMLDCNRRVLGIGNQLSGGSGFAAQLFQYV